MRSTGALRLSLLVAVAAAAFCIQPARPALAQAEKTATPKKKLPAPEELDLVTGDGVQLKATYLPGTKGKETVPVVLLHMWKGSSRDYDSLAAQLQREGHAVVIPDLRGHGDSTRVQGRARPTALDEITLRPADFQNMVRFDMEAINSFLLEENNAGHLNIEKLCVIGAEMGANVALVWAALDWSWPQLPSLKQGRDVKALVLISPRFTFKGLAAKPALASPDVRTEISMLFIVGDQDRDSVRDARSMHKVLEKFHPLPDEKDAEAKQDLFLMEYETSLQGTQILAERSMGVDKMILRFIDLRLVKQNFPWSDRTSPLD